MQRIFLNIGISLCVVWQSLAIFSVGQEVTYDFSGVITTIDNNENDVIPDLDIGDSFTGFAAFESSGWHGTVGTVSVTINGVELYFSGQYIYGEVVVDPGVLYDIRIAGDNGGEIGNSTFSAFNFGPDLVDSDGSAGITESFPDSLDLNEFEDRICRIWGNYVATGDQIFITGELDEFVKRMEFEIGDVNRDGSVDLLDVQPFVDLVLSGKYQAEADINGDGSVNALDIQPFIDLLTSD